MKFLAIPLLAVAGIMVSVAAYQPISYAGKLAFAVAATICVVGAAVLLLTKPPPTP